MRLRDLTVPARAHEQGAALVLMVAMVGIGALAWQVRASLSQLLVAQQMLDQSAAAAALSAAQFHARLLNAHAFLNRTAMAHQVAMAHLLTIASAEKLRLEMGKRFLRRNPPVHLIAMMFGPHHAAAYAASRLGVAGATDRGIRELHRAFKDHDRAVSATIVHWRSQIQRGVADATRTLVRDVVARNLLRDVGTAIGRQTDFRVSVTHPAGLIASVRSDRQSTMRRAWFDAVMSQHDYLQSRRHTAYNWWVVNPKCPLMFHQLRRRGKNRLSVDGPWQATDTLSFHAMRGHHWLVCYWREYPMGWSKIDHHATDQSRQAAQAIRAVSPEGVVGGSFIKYILAQHALGNLLLGFNNTLAEDMADRTRIVWHRRGRLVLSRLDTQPPAVIVVTVEQPLFALASRSLVLGLRVAGLLQVPGGWPEALTARAAAQTYFDRYIPRPDGLAEVANLFQPFWGARNVPVTP